MGSKTNILVTGTAGFIGFHLVNELMKHENNFVFGIDNINDYYDVNLKYGRLAISGINRNDIEEGKTIQSNKYPNYKFCKMDITDLQGLENLFNQNKFDIVVNLAAQAGVRYSLKNPHSYVQSNIVGFVNILECCRYNSIKHLVYASSSSVYGMTKKVPFAENDRVDYPVSLYAATKKSNELLAHTYSHLYQLPTTGLRFFTVYGPWGRPDMAPMIFADSILKGNSINVFNNGEMERDFTYVDDIVKGVSEVMSKIPGNDDVAYYRLFNIGNSEPVKLMDFVSVMENALGKQAIKNMQPMQPGDVKITYADTSNLETAIGYKPTTNINEGVQKFIAWYREYSSKCMRDEFE